MTLLEREAFDWIIADIDRIWSELLNKDIQVGFREDHTKERE